MANNTPTAKGDYEVGNKKPPKNRQFGQPEGNPRNLLGGWKKTETARWKFEQIIKMSEEELRELLANPSTAKFERLVAEVLLDPTLKPMDKMSVVERMTNQVYGTPKQQIEQVTIEPPVPLSPRKQKKE